MGWGEEKKESSGTCDQEVQAQLDPRAQMAESGIWLYYLVLSWLSSQADSLPVAVPPDAPEYGPSRPQALFLPLKSSFFFFFLPSVVNKDLGQMLMGSDRPCLGPVTNSEPRVPSRSGSRDGFWSLLNHGDGEWAVAGP